MKLLHPTDPTLLQVANTNSEIRAQLREIGSIMQV